MTSRQVIRRLLDEGWYEVRQKPVVVTVSTHRSKGTPSAMRDHIFRQAGWK